MSRDSGTAPLRIDGPTSITTAVVRDIVVAAGGSLRLSGQVQGDITVLPGGALIMLGVVKGGVINKGGDVDVFGFVGRIEDRGTTDTMLSMGAIVGGKRVPRPMPFRRLRL
ncbi:hypothetical protein [Sphingomonas sp.]|uniref:hypothetical protein n=1 Tax=Sphingomonas sp. TaxID=28214 RepID=UPI0035BBEA58